MLGGSGQTTVVSPSPTPGANAGTVTSHPPSAGTLSLGVEPGPSSGVTFKLPARPHFPAPGATPAGDEELRVAQAQLAAESAELRRMREERAAVVAKQKEAADTLAREAASKTTPPAIARTTPTAAPAAPDKPELRPKPPLIIAASVPRIETASVVQGMRVFDISELDQTPVARFQARPQYPYEMRRQKIGGEAVVDFIIDTNGEVVNAYAIRSSRVEFEAAAVQAVSKWRFKPGRKGGRDVPTHMQVPIVFTLNEN